jgi:hypothetical protein
MAKRNTEPADDAQQMEIRQKVERAVAECMQELTPKLQAQIAQHVLENLPPQGTHSAATPRQDSGSLVEAVTHIHAGNTQKEILRALLDRGSAHCSRIALFVVKSGAASGWQARGFSSDEAITDLPLDLHAGPAAHAYQNRVATPGNIAEMDGRFVEVFGGPTDEQVLLLPLTLKDKVAALIYADGGDSGTLDASALELLVLATGAWLEVTSLRKQAAKGDADAASSMAHTPAPMQPPAPPIQIVSSFPDPFASHAPKHVPVTPAIPQPAASEPAQQEAAEVVEVEPARAAAASSAAAPAAAADPWAGLSPEDADIHRKAQRFARLLVDEIKLYNQAKVAEGRRNKDLYDRLKEDIEKSRGTFQKRYGSTVAASGDYFQHELLRSLAEDDATIMGANFRQLGR